jgi:hypothetical protein
VTSEKSVLTEARLGALIARTPVTVINTGTQTISSTTPAAISGLSAPVAAGTYRFTIVIHCIQGSVQAQQAMRITGPATSQARFFCNAVTVATGVTVNLDTQTTLGSDTGQPGGGGFAAAATWLWHAEGFATFTAAGNFVIQARCVTSNADTYTIRPGAFFDLWPVS